MRGVILTFALGIWLLQQQAVLPNMTWAAWAILPLVLALLTPRHPLALRILRYALLCVCAGLLGFCYAAWFAQQRIGTGLDTANQGIDIEIIGVVADMPRQRERGLSFTFDVEQVLSPGIDVPPHILLSTYDNDQNDALTLHAGERWHFTVRLKQPHGSINPHGFDFEAWMLEQNLRATGYLQRKGKNTRLDELVRRPAYLIENLRETLRDRFQHTLGDAPYTGILIALAVGDQSSIPAGQWQVFTRTGVNHLMSISGLHITMLAGLTFALTYALWRRSARLTLLLPARKAAIITGLLTALAYALLSGYSVPAQRTVYMLATLATALWLSRTVAPTQILAAALLPVLLLDPWAVLAPGFWLSFGAVALIFYVTAHRLRAAHWLSQYGQVQWAMTIGLAPALLALFQQVSLVAPLANAVAIPLVSFIVVPVTLAGALLPLDWLLQLAHLAMSLCMLVIEWLDRMPDPVWTQHAPPPWSVFLGMAGALWCLLPRGFPARWLGLLSMLPMFLTMPDSPQPGALRLTIFDVGQGLAVAAQTHNHVLLYDTGPAFNSEADSGNRILVPALRGMGIARLDQLVLTHDDSDHTGGASSVMQAIPVGLLTTSLPPDSPLLQGHNHQRCISGQSWDWDGVHFELLHPSALSYGQPKISKNNRSCVLRVSAGMHSVLLAGDIEKDAEGVLLQHAAQLPATLLVVPHHGSKTSSTSDFVQAVRPRYAVFTTGYRNRYGHPKAEVVERYRAIDTELFRSDVDGAIIVNMNAQNFSVERYRATHERYWRQTVAVAP
jgi:competence protein ComEC